MQRTVCWGSIIAQIDECLRFDGLVRGTRSRDLAGVQGRLVEP
ncbi:hypothetical protein ACFCW6_33430 [Streptomyces sp. NPDC056333]